MNKTFAKEAPANQKPTPNHDFHAQFCSRDGMLHQVCFFHLLLYLLRTISIIKKFVGDFKNYMHLLKFFTSLCQFQQKSAAKAQTSSHFGHEYVTFMRACSEQLRQVVVDEIYVNRLFEVKKMYCTFSKIFTAIFLFSIGTMVK